jgi:hypothetical protein
MRVLVRSRSVRQSFHDCLGSGGFTLVELVIATLISSLVMGIISVALGFSLRVWERLQNQNPSDMPAVMDLLKWQLATLEPQTVRIDQESVPVFKGDTHSLTFATTHSVKAISKGAPVVARYVYVPEEKALYYAEIPLDPYHSEPLEDFLKSKPEKSKKRSRFFSTAAAEFSLAFAAPEEIESFGESWEEDNAVPGLVVVKWSPDGQSRFTTTMVPNSLFPRHAQEAKKGESAFKEDE